MPARKKSNPKKIDEVELHITATIDRQTCSDTFKSGYDLGFQQGMKYACSIINLIGGSDGEETNWMCEKNHEKEGRQEVK